MRPPRSVDEYIATAPAGTQAALRRVRASIQAAAPNAEEGISYGLPFYSHKSETGINRRLCYFNVQKPSLRLYFRPRDLAPHSEEVADYRSTNSALHFPIDRPPPLGLIRNLVRDAYKRHREEKRR